LGGGGWWRAPGGGGAPTLWGGGGVGAQTAESEREKILKDNFTVGISVDELGK
jgi:hypothetical protein